MVKEYVLKTPGFENYKELMEKKKECHKSKCKKRSGVISGLFLIFNKK